MYLQHLSRGVDDQLDGNQTLKDLKGTTELSEFRFTITKVELRFINVPGTDEDWMDQKKANLDIATELKSWESLCK